MVSDKIIQPTPQQAHGKAEIFIPENYRVEIRLDGQTDVSAVAVLVAQTFGSAVVTERRVTGRLAGRSSILIGSYPREIAEARVETFRSRARLGRVSVQAVIRRED